MNARAIANEFAKMRHLRVGLFVALLAISVALMSMYNAFGSGAFERLDDPNDYAWKILFDGLGMGAALIAPILVAVIASRQVEIEHTGNGWLSSATSGLTPGQMCRAKFVSLGVLVAAATAVWGVVIVGFGTLIGISTPAPLGRWATYIGALIIINLAVLAFHIRAVGDGREPARVHRRRPGRNVPERSSASCSPPGWPILSLGATTR